MIKNTSPLLFLTALFCVFLSVLSLPYSAMGEESHIYGHGLGYKNPVAERYKAMKAASMATAMKPPVEFIRPKRIDISIVKYPYMEFDQFGIMMSAPQIVSGCYEVSPLEYEAKYVEPYYLEVKVKNFKRTLIQSKSPQFDCPATNSMSSSVLLLSRSELIKRNISQIKFISDYATDKYNVKIVDKGVILLPESMIVFKAKGLLGPMNDRLVVSFESGGLIDLHVPMIHDDEDISKQMMEFAKANALNPVKESLEIKGRAARGTRVYTFEDVTGRFSGDIEEDGYLEVGAINVPRPYTSAEGTKLIPVPLRVFATKHGTRL